MSQARERSEWNRAASIIVKINNVHASKKSELIRFQDVHPYFMVQKSTEPTEMDLEILKHAIESW